MVMVMVKVKVKGGGEVVMRWRDDIRRGGESANQQPQSRVHLAELSSNVLTMIISR